jgi:hypothetical protein
VTLRWWVADPRRGTAVAQPEPAGLIDDTATIAGDLHVHRFMGGARANLRLSPVSVFGEFLVGVRATFGYIRMFDEGESVGVVRGAVGAVFSF